MLIGIAGAGAIAMGYASYLLKMDHTPSVWSPSGERTIDLRNGVPLAVTGTIEGQFMPKVCQSAEALAKNEVIILALPAYGHRAVLDALLPYIEPRHCVIISGHLSFAALYLSKRLAERGMQIPIVVWSTTALTAKAPVSPIQVRVGLIRKKINMATIPRSLAHRAAEICVGLFGDRFDFKNDLISIALSNLNPQNHLGIALCNLTRIERGEDWCQNTNITPAVANLLVALDQERVDIAKAFGKTVRTIGESMSAALGVSGSSVAEMYQLQAERGNNPLGPKDLKTRYVLEDVPFGLFPTLMLAQLVGVTAPLHKSGVDILSACYNRDFAKKNDLLSALGELNSETLTTLAINGYPMAERTAKIDSSAREFT